MDGDHRPCPFLQLQTDHNPTRLCMFSFIGFVFCHVWQDALWHKYDRDYCSRPLNSIRDLKKEKKKKAKSICTRKIKQVENFLSRCSHCSKSRLITAMYYSIFCLRSHNDLQTKEFDLLYECCFFIAYFHSVYYFRGTYRSSTSIRCIL